MGPKLYRVTIFFSSEVVRLATETYIFFELWRQMPHQNISLDKVLSDSGQDCVDLSPIENYIFWMGPKVYRVTIFFGSDVLRPKL